MTITVDGKTLTVEQAVDLCNFLMTQDKTATTIATIEKIEDTLEEIWDNE